MLIKKKQKESVIYTKIFILSEAKEIIIKIISVEAKGRKSILAKKHDICEPKHKLM